MKSKQDFLTAKESPGVEQPHVLQTESLAATEGSVEAAAGRREQRFVCACVCACVPACVYAGIPGKIT